LDQQILFASAFLPSEGTQKRISRNPNPLATPKSLIEDLSVARTSFSEELHLLTHSLLQNRAFGHTGSGSLV
jgi:hypothetical protein